MVDERRPGQKTAPGESGQESGQGIGLIARVHADPRKEAIRLLQGAAELEHMLVLTYLYAGYSVTPEHWGSIVGAVQSDAGVSRTLSQVAVEEMVHLRKVNRLLVELGASPHLRRPPLPYRSGLYPFELELEPLTRKSLVKYLFIEAPPEGMIGWEEIERAGVEWPHVESKPVGSVYRTVRDVLREMTDEPAERIDGWVRLVYEIIAEGEQDHYTFLLDVFRGNATLFAGDPWATGGVSRPLVRADVSSVAVGAGGAGAAAGSSGEVLALARLANAGYWASLETLEAVFGGRHHRSLAGCYRALMVEVLDPIGFALAGEGAGVPFDVMPPRRAGLDALASAVAQLDEAMTIESKAIGAPVREAMARVRDQLEQARTAERRVVIAGGGPAGLAAAWALSRTGLEVVLVDRGQVVGGKAETFWTGKRSTDHGVHGWWPCYVNFDAMLTDCGVDVSEALIQASGTGIVAESGELDFIATSTLHVPFPFYLARLVYRPKLVDFMAVARSWLVFMHVMAFEHGEDYAKWDDMTFADLAKVMNVDPGIFKNLLAPFSYLFDYASPDELSASALLSALQVYLLPTQDAPIPRWSHGLPDFAIFQPLRKALEARGVTFATSSEVAQIEADDRGVLGVTVRALSLAGGSRDVTVPLAKLPIEGELKVHEQEGTRLILGRRQGRLTVFSGSCPHQNGALMVEDGAIRCSKHGARFSADGIKLSGPGDQDLTAEPSHPVDAGVVVRCAASRAIPCGHVIAATDVRAASALLDRSVLPPSAAELVARMRELKATSVVVVRLWFQHGTPTPMMQTVIIPRGKLAEVYFDLGQIDGSYEGEGVVVEVHSSDPGNVWSAKSDAEILAGALADLQLLAPSFTADRLQKDGYEIRRHGAVFTLYEPGSDKLRPGAETPVAGLHLAGDWTRVDAAIWMMERAVVTGIRAANAVRSAVGMEPAPILALPEGGKRRSLARALARAVLYVKDRL